MLVVLNREWNEQFCLFTVHYAGVFPDGREWLAVIAIGLILRPAESDNENNSFTAFIQFEPGKNVTQTARYTDKDVTRPIRWLRSVKAGGNQVPTNAVTLSASRKRLYRHPAVFVNKVEQGRQLHNVNGCFIASNTQGMIQFVQFIKS